MKKNIIISTVLFALSLFGASAQDKAPVSPLVAKSIETSFSGATNVRIEPFKNAVRCRFQYLGNVWLVFYSKEGSLIARGRLIKSTNDLPFLVQSGITKAKNGLEKKFGAATILSIYEMMDGTITDYYVTLDNSKVHAIYSISPQGSAVLKTRGRKAPAQMQRVDAIAQKD